MTYEVLLSSTAARQLRKLTERERDRIVKALRNLGEDPLTARPRADIRVLEGTAPKKHRLRVGPYRVIYAVTGTDVRVIEVFRRGRGYR
ncbi:MAG: type II toxin-antitoxin system RelE/ParE family toxin [Thermoplasmata archaeon]